MEPAKEKLEKIVFEMQGSEWFRRFARVALKKI
jgi:hypothetical protein